MPEFIDLVFAKTSPKRTVSITENERFGLVFVKNGSINSGTGRVASKFVYTKEGVNSGYPRVFAKKVLRKYWSKNRPVLWTLCAD